MQHHSQQPQQPQQPRPQASDLASVLSFCQLKCAYYQAHFQLTKHPRDQYLADFYSEAVGTLEGFRLSMLPADNFTREEFLFLFRPGRVARFTERDNHMLNVVSAEIEAKRDRAPDAHQAMAAFILKVSN